LDICCLVCSGTYDPTHDRIFSLDSHRVRVKQAMAIDASAMKAPLYFSMNSRNAGTISRTHATPTTSKATPHPNSTGRWMLMGQMLMGQNMAVTDG
jgi:hypothetical protein